MNKIENDKLKDVFAKVKTGAPSMSFENNLMQCIREEQRLAERRNSRIALLSMILGVVAMILTPLLIFRILGWSIVDVLGSSDTSFLDTLYVMKMDPLILSISIVCLLLLMADTLIRTLISRKEKK